MRLATTIAILILSTACRDDAVTAFNSNPEATITSHQGGEQFLDGYVETFRGSVSDPDDAVSNLSVRWYIGSEEACASASPASDGTTECAIALSEADSQVTLEVIDASNAAGTTSVSFTVLPTDAPVVTITYPELTGVYYADQLITFEGTAYDEEDEAITLLMEWESNVDGPLSVDAIPDKNGLAVGFGYLSAGEHAVSLNATDSTGKTGTDTITVTVGAANSTPSCSISSPKTGDAGPEGELIIFEAEVSDADIAANLLALDWSSDKDGALGSSTADSSGYASFAWSELSVNTHTVSLNVTDDVGSICTANVIYTVGQPPSVAITSPITGDIFTMGENIVFSATVSDNEDLPTALSIEWASDIDGVLSTIAADSSGEATFANNSLQAGLHTVTLTVTDTDGLYGVHTIQISLNEAPVVGSVVITPSKGVTVESTLACVATATDTEDGTLSPTGYTWENTSTATALGVGSGLTLTSKIAANGNTITCEASFEDGDGATVSGSASVLVGNSAPSVASVSIIPDPAYAGDVLSCTYTGFDDVDGDSDASSLEWFVNSVSAGSSTTLSTALVEGEVVECVVTPSDGTDSGSPVSASLIISNTPPVLADVTLGADPIYEGESLTCSPGSTTDADGTISFTYSYAWTVDGSAIAPTTSTLSSLYFSKGEEVACSVTPNDGSDDGAAVTSNSVQVANTVPSITIVTISPNPASAADTLTCGWSGWYDVDGDSDISHLEWTVNGTTAGTGTTLSGAFTGSDIVTCLVTPFDGTDEGIVVSESITIGNEAPSITSVSISPDPAYAGETLTCSYGGFYDSDGDPDASTVSWTVNGSAAGTDVTLATALSQSDVVVCTVTPSDGASDGTPLAASLTISNTPPVLASVTLSPDPAYESDTMSCAAGVTTDADGTASFSYSYGWTINGAALGVTAYSLDGSYFDRGDDVACLVTANDGTDDGATVTSNIVTIGNSVPAISSVSISPDPAYATDALTCVTTGFSDADGDTDQTWHEWTVNGVVKGATATLAGSFYAGDLVACTATPSDGTADGAALTSSLLISNTAPVLSSVLLGPDPAYEDDTLVCTPGTISDADGTASFTYATNWVVNSVPQAVTDTTLDGSYFDKTDVVYCTVTPNDGTSDGAAVSSNLVTIDNSIPTISTVSISPDPATVVDTLICSAGGFSDADGDPDLSTIEWKVNGTSVSTAATLASGFVGGDGVTCTITPNDGEDTGTPLSATVLIANSVPSITSVNISPSPAYAADTLTCSASGFYDADGDADLTTYSWSVGGSVIGSGTTLASGFNLGDTVTCTATPFDGTDTGTAVDASISIGNSPPVLASVSLTPDPASESDTLTCLPGTTTDADGSVSFTYSYLWAVNGAVQAATGTTLDGGYFDKGDDVTCVVTPNDGTGDGAAVTSNLVTIANSVPTVSTATITPDPATMVDTLVCSASGFSDDDGDADLSTISWAVNGLSAGTGSTLVGGFAGGDGVTCTVTPYDGEDNGTPVSTTIVIENSTPYITGVTISPNPAYTGDLLTCSTIGFYDADGDTDQTVFSWSVNGTPTGSGATLSGGFGYGDTVTCLATPFDGTTSGTAMEASLSIGNSPPVLSSVSLTPDPAFESSTLTCTPGATTDSDGGASFTYSYLWAVNGAVQAATGTTLDGSSFDKGNDITCVVTPNDGTSDGAAVTSNVVTISNSTPSISSVAISPSPATVVDTLVCSAGGFSDEDGDTNLSTIAWAVNGISAGTGSTLVGGFAGGDGVTCTVTPYDGEDSGSPIATTIVIENSAPYISGVTISPNPAYTGDLLTCATSGFYDADGDPEQTVFSWSVGGVGVGTGATLSGGFGYGDTVTCTATPFDSTDYGIAMDASITIGNSPPVLASVSLGPDPAFEGDLLTCTEGATTDSDGSFLFTYSYVWAVNGGVIGETSDTLSSADFDKNDTVTCTVTPNDGTGDGAAVTSNVVTISNSTPAISSVTITPDPASVIDILTCAWSGWTDADGDADASTATWMINGTDAGSGVNLMGGFGGGDTVTCTVTPDDGEETGTPLSAAVVINNTTPYITGVTISPEPAYVGDTLICSSAGFYDADGDTEQTTYEWSIGFITIGTGPTLSSGFSVGDTVVCTATPSDGVDSGTAMTASVTIGNSPPVLSSVSLGPDPTYEGGELICTPGATSDSDGAVSFTYTYEWAVNGGVLGTTTASLTSAYFDKNDDVVCIVTPNDGSGDGAAVTSNVITISNSLPTIGSISVTPDPAGVGDTLTCLYTGWTDADGDSNESTISWTIDGVVVGSSSALAGVFSGGDEVFCTVTPYDGQDTGAALSASVSIVNNAPSIATVTISPDPATVVDALNCSYSGFYDEDGDADASIINWTIGGVVVGTGSTLAGSFSSGDSVVCTVTPSDGTDAGTPLSDSVAISNSPPVIASVSVTPSPAYEDDTVVCAPGATSDADGSASFTYSYAWAINGIAIATTSPSLTGGDFDKGDELVCTVTASDGTDTSTPVSSAPVSVNNSLPTISSVSIAPDPAGEGDTLTCGWGGWSDLDGDADGSVVSWTVDGVVIGTGATLASGFVSDDTVVCTVTPYDGEDYGSEVSASLTIQADNLAPEVYAITLSPANVYTDTLLIATVNAGDAEGDPVSLTYDWYVDSALVLSGVDQDALDGDSYFDKGLPVWVEVTPNDGFRDGATVASGTVTVLNTAPDAPTVALEPALPVAEVDDLVCAVVVDSDDLDADTVTYTINWELDSVAWTGAVYTTTYTGDTIGAADTSPGDHWVCTVTPHDGTQSGTVATAEVNITSGDPPARWPQASYILDYNDIDIVIDGANYGGNTGYKIALAGDVDGDGLPDILVSSPGVDNWGNNDGMVSLFFGSTLQAGGRFDPYSPDWLFHSEDNDDWFGSSVASAGDVDGDGFDDILIGAYGGDEGGGSSGEVYLVFGKYLEGTTGSVNLPANFSDYGVRFHGDAGNDHLGADTSMTSVDDIDGDGLSDILLGSRYDDSYGADAGQAYLFFGSWLTEEHASRDSIVPVNEYAYTFYGHDSNDYLGQAVASANDVDGDGLPDLVMGAYGYNGSYGAVYIVSSSTIWMRTLFGFSQQFYMEDEYDYRIVSDRHGYFGYAVATNGDVDGDGYNDLLVGQHGNNEITSESGAVYLFLGSELNWGDNDLDDAAYKFVLSNSSNASDNLGISVSFAGDVDGDGLSDLLIGSPGDDDWASNSGKVFLVLASSLPEPGGTFDLAFADFAFVCPDDNCSLGHMGGVSPAGDIDQDGLDDIFMGARYNDQWGTDDGSAYIVLAHRLFNGGYDINMDYADWKIYGQASGDYFGGVIASAGDVDGDGLEDLLFGSHENDSNGDRSGEAYLVFGSQLASSWPDGGDINADDNQRFYGNNALDYAGYDVDSAGDIDGDGLDDLLIGAPFNSEGTTLGGQAYLILAASLDVNGGHLDLSADLDEADYGFLPESPFDYVGWSLAGLGDIDGDDLPDIAIGAPFDDDEGSNSGAVYLFLNTSLAVSGDIDVADADYKLVGEDALEQAGYSVTSAGDVDGDGLNDILVLAASNDDGATDAGKVYLVLAADLPAAGGTVSLADAHFSFTSETANGGDTLSIASAGDVDGDNLDDLLFGVPFKSASGTEAGRVYLVLGNAMAVSGTISLDDDADFIFDGQYSYEYTGHSVSSAGDMDGDGLDDIIIGAPGNDEWDTSSDAGKAYMIYGASLFDLPSVVSLGGDMMDRYYDYAFVGANNGHWLGSAVLTADVNGDGFPDPVIGGSDYNGQTGSVWIKHNPGL